MMSQVQDFVSEQMQALSGQAEQFTKDPFAAAREGFGYSVEGLKALQEPVRVAARSGVQLSSLSQKSLQQLIELQSDAVTATLSEIAEGLERAARAKDMAALVSAQAEALRLSAERMVSDANRALEIFTTAGRGTQQIVTETVEKLAKKPVEHVARTAKAKGKGSRKAA